MVHSMITAARLTAVALRSSTVAALGRTMGAFPGDPPGSSAGDGNWLAAGPAGETAETRPTVQLATLTMAAAARAERKNWRINRTS